MTDRGWGWTPTEIRQAQLVEWIAQQPPDQVASVVEFYDALPDQGMNAWDVAHADLKRLEARGQIKLSTAMGGIAGLHVYQFQGARAAAEELQVKRADKRRRRRECRDAILSWLASVDAVSSSNVQVLSNMLSNTRFGMWFAQPFAVQDVSEAASWLNQRSLIECATIAGNTAPMFAFLSDDGIKCVDDLDSRTDLFAAWQDEEQRASLKDTPAYGPTFNFGPNAGIVQIGGAGANQVATQSDQVSTDRLVELINGLADLVLVLVPDASGADEQLSTALIAAQPGAVDPNILQRFADWVVSTVRAGATASATAAVSSATTAMLMEAAHLAHL
jgi:hypothetical protein